MREFSGKERRDDEWAEIVKAREHIVDSMTQSTRR